MPRAPPVTSATRRASAMPSTPVHRALEAEPPGGVPGRPRRGSMRRDSPETAANGCRSTAAVHALRLARRVDQEPRGGGAHAPVRGGTRLRHRLAPDERRPLRRGRRRPRHHGIDQGGAARLRHDGRPRPVGRRLHPRPRPLRRLHPRARRGARHPARPFRAQGAAAPPLGRRRPARAHAGDRGLGRMGAGGAERPRRARSRTRCRAPCRATRSRRWWSASARPRAAPTRRASTCSRSTARTATSSTSSCRPSPTAATTSTAAPT